MADLGRRCRAPRSARRPMLLSPVLLSTFGLLASVTATAAPVLVDSGPAHAASVAEVMAWAPYWETNTSLASFNANSAQMAEMTPFFWSATSVTDIVRNPAISDLELAQFKTAAANASKPFIATITDGLPARAMAGLLAIAETRTAHVNAIVAFAQNGDYAGVDLDYEKFAFSDGKSSWTATHDYWGAFLTELSAALHAAGKMLTVAVPPIYNSRHDADSGYWVYNYPAMALAVDRIRVMTYSYSVSSAGPIAPYNWVSSSMDAALAIVPADKLEMGIPAYGNDWVTKIEGDCPSGISPTKRSITTRAAAAYAASKGVKPSWDPATRERTFTYIDSFTGLDGNDNTVRCNVTRTAWYNDPDAIHQRVMLAQSKGLRGVAIWALGYDDAVTWQGIANARAGQPFLAPVPPEPTPRPAPGPPINSPISPLPSRFLDTRTGQKTTDGQFNGKGRLNAGTTLEVNIAGRGTVPADAEAVTLNVTVIGEGNGFVTVYPCGIRPTTSSLNVRSGQIISNSVITKLSETGTVCIFAQSAAHLVVDVFNVLPAAAFSPVESPARLLDTRVGLPTIDGQYIGAGALDPGGIVEVQIAGRGGMSSSARTAVLNVTSDGAVGPGYLTVWNCDVPPPSTSNVNYTTSAPIPNAVVTALSARGTVCVLSSNRTHVVIDTFGELEPTRYLPLAQPTRLLDTRVGGSTVDGYSSGGGIEPAGSVIELQVAGRGGLAGSAKAAILNVTVDGPTGNGFLTIYPCDSGRPLVSNVNFATGQTLPNLVVTELSGAGTVCIYNMVSTHIVVDVFGTLTL